MRIEPFDEGKAILGIDQNRGTFILQSLKLGSGRNFKFVATKSTPEELTIHIFGHCTHIKCAETVLKEADNSLQSFVGAGEGDSSNLEWGSMTCRDSRLGKDRPQDPDEAERVLKEIRTAILGLISIL